MSAVNLTLVATPFASNPAWTVEQFHQAVVGSITGATTTSNVMLGQIGGSLPTSDVGPWMNQGAWYYWTGSTYAPSIPKVGNAFFEVTLTGTPITANRTINFPDKSGTVALTSDVFTGRGTVILSQVTATPAILWGNGSSFSVSLTRNISITNSDSQPGQVIQLALHQPTAGVWTVTWPSDINWGTAGVPADPITADRTDVVELSNVGGQIYGKLVINLAA